MRKGRFSEKDPYGEEGDSEEVAEEDEGLLDQACEQADRSIDGTDLEIAEATSLESEEIGIWWTLSRVNCRSSV